MCWFPFSRNCNISSLVGNGFIYSDSCATCFKHEKVKVMSLSPSKCFRLCERSKSAGHLNLITKDQQFYFAYIGELNKQPAKRSTQTSWDWKHSRKQPGSLVRYPAGNWRRQVTFSHLFRPFYGTVTPRTWSILLCTLREIRRECIYLSLFQVINLSVWGEERSCPLECCLSNSVLNAFVFLRIFNMSYFCTWKKWKLE